MLELIVVTAVTTLLLSLAAPLVSQVLTANQITIGAQTVVDRLNLARLTALTKNRVVETRFYKFVSMESVDTVEHTRAVQNFIFDETNTRSWPLDEVHYLPEAAVISSDTTYSSLMQPGRQKTNWTSSDVKPSLPRGIDQNHSVHTVRFKPDGSTDLGSGSWFVTVRSMNGPATPPNYATVHIDPYNGSLRLYRPEL